MVVETNSMEGFGMFLSTFKRTLMVTLALGLVFVIFAIVWMNDQEVIVNMSWVDPMTPWYR